MRGRAFALAAAAAVAAAAVAPGAAAAPVGQITESATAIPSGDQPYGLVAGPDGNLWIGLQGTDNAIERLAPNGTSQVFNMGLQANNHSSIQILALGPDGNVWFSDTGTAPLVGKVTPGGTITEYPLPSGAVAFGLAAGPDGNLWFTDVNHHEIGRITPTGTVNEYSTGLNSGANPNMIAAGPDGNMWFTDQGSTKAIGKVTPAGTITEYPSGAGSYPIDIAQGPDGNMWFTDPGAKAVGRITPQGTITDFTSGLPVYTYPYGITPGPDGDVWFVDGGDSSTAPTSIDRIDPHTGEITIFTGLQGTNGMDSAPYLITVGANGNLWNSDQGANGGVRELAQVGTGAQPASIRPPSVTGSGQAGTQQVCEGDQWSTWAGLLPADDQTTFDGIQWLRDGTAIAGASAAAYTPPSGDVGHQLACRVTVTYPLTDVTTSATSAAVTVIPLASGPQGLQGKTGPPGPAGKVELVTCKTAKHKKKPVCTTKLVSGPVKFKVAARAARAELVRRGVVYATGYAAAGGSTRLLVARTLRPGRYTLLVTSRGRVLTRRAVTVS